jgi:hypothetical protein
MKKIILSVLVIFLFLFNGIGQTVNVTVGTVTSIPGGQIAYVPVTVSGLDADNGGTPVMAFNLDIAYDMNIVTYLDITNLNPLLCGGTCWNYETGDDGQLHIDWGDGGFLGQSLPDGSVLFECRFIANIGGTSALTINPATIEFQDEGSNFLPTTVTNGSVQILAPLASTVWTGTGDWYTLTNWNPGLPGKTTQVTIQSGVATIFSTSSSTPKAYSGNISIAPGAGVTINAGTNASLNVNGNLVLESDASQMPTGALLRNGNLVVSGTITAKRFLTGGTQHFISMPVGAVTIQDLINPVNTGYLFRFNESANGWENPWEVNDPLGTSRGYSINYDGPETIAVHGALNNDSKYVPAVTYTTGQGFNLVGNPYSCALDWLAGSGWTKSNVANAIYVWNNTAYASFVDGVSVNGGSRYIPQFQGFFIQTTAAAPTLEIKKAARVQNTTNFMKEEVANLFRLSISNGSLGEETAVYMRAGATESFDSEYDAHKLFGFNAEAPHIYTSFGEYNFAINGQPMVESLSIPVKVKTSQSGEFTFTASGFESFDGYYFFILEDKVNGINFDLKKNSELVLNLNAGETNDRFMLRIFKSALGIGDEVSASIHIYSENKSVYIENCTEGQVDIYNMAGKVVSSSRVAESSLNMISLNVPTGIYVVKMTTQNSSISSKVFIK